MANARWLKAFSCLLVLLFAALPHAYGLVLFGDQDPNFNATAPGGIYADGGWDSQGAWGIGGATAISPKHILTSNHFANNSGKFIFHGVEYTATSIIDSGGSDLRIVEVDGLLPAWSLLYEDQDETGQEALVYGRGNTAGSPVEVSGEAKGWRWSAAGNGTLRWGTNQVLAAGLGLLEFDFDADAGPDEAMLADRDSGSGLFLQDGDGQWKLAGVNFGADGLYDLDGDHSDGQFRAALFDEGGLWEYRGAVVGWQHVADKPYDLPGVFRATRVSDEIGWIHDQIPELGHVPGDMMWWDFKLTIDDLQLFLLALADKEAYMDAYQRDPDILGDMNRSGGLTIDDLQPFLEALAASDTDQQMTTYQGIAVPEPTALALLAAGGVALLRRRRRR